MSPTHIEPATVHGDLAAALSRLADATADTLRLLHRIALQHRHTNGQRSATPTASGPTDRLRAPRRLDSTGMDSACARRPHRFRRRR